MSFFSSGLFWFVEGVFACLAVLGLKLWAEDRGIPMPFWKWVLAGIWIVLLGFTIAFVGTSLGENEVVAARLGGELVFSRAPRRKRRSQEVQRDTRGRGAPDNGAPAASIGGRLDVGPPVGAQQERHGAARFLKA